MLTEQAFEKSHILFVLPKPIKLFISHLKSPKHISVLVAMRTRTYRGRITYF